MPRIDAHVTGRVAELVPIFEHNRFDGCVYTGEEDHPLVVARPRMVDAADFHALRDAEQRGRGVDLSAPPDAAWFRRFPSLRVAVPLSEIALTLAAEPRLYLKMIVTPERKALAAAALRAFGVERCMFASGWPECESWKRMLASFTQACGPLPQAVRERLLGGTAAEFYRVGAE